MKNSDQLWRLGKSDLGLLVHRDFKGLVDKTTIIRISSFLRKFSNINITDYVEPDPLTVVRMAKIPNDNLGLVMLAILAIPRGFVASYSDLAELLNMTPRLIGLFASKNPMPVLIPCHRVINRDGTIGGYSAWHRDGKGIKAMLLSMENVRVNGIKVSKDNFVDSSELKDNFYRIYNYYHSLMSEYSSSEQSE
ncbi:MGMT family protein [Caldivirga maquilingensis]|uniref:Methylated-DNA--protein-cysteine methyltransferase n=1 Tax=Caldivirga maquilingensis (strain ATCC 700844 / DSM 13496 / JCM 10307 / IC-167) TaxID=397948 RepID=A8MDP1_CALMQ|nr:MGMT family protein [Caldivirga maquilingensis]ABW01897.1 methylated-DNA--protein-cysteine methyltransferase [Caldivirga maquilingensis IC-167]